MTEIEIIFLKTIPFNTAKYIVIAFLTKDLNNIFQNMYSGYFQLKTSEFIKPLMIIPLFLFSFPTFPKFKFDLITTIRLYLKNTNIVKDKEIQDYNFLILDQEHIFRNVCKPYYSDIITKLFFDNLLEINSKIYCYLISNNN